MRCLETLLCLAGLLLSLLGLGQVARYQGFQYAAAAIPLRPALHVASPILGELDIPRLHLKLPVLDNDDAGSLALSIGHIPGTSPLGSLGNAGIAGHRDTSFRPLCQIRIGDRIEVHTGHDSVYVVKQIQIVDPDNTNLLRESASPLLTLVTCYPFTYLGSAPRRFVIQAALTAN